MRLPRPGSLPSVRDLDKVKVGLVSLAVIAAMVAAAFSIGTLGIFQDRYQMSGVFTDTGGLRTGAKVKLAGVDVGTVTAVDPDFESGQVVITWEVDRGIDLGPATRAEVAVETLLGGHHLRLSGPVVEPYMADLDRSERRIPIERTRVPFTVIGAVGETTRSIEALDVEALNQIVLELAGISDANADALEPLLVNLQAVLAAIDDREVELDRLLGNAQQVSATLAAKDQQLVALIDAASVVLDQLDQRRGELAALLGSSDRAVTTLADLIAANRGHLESIVADLHLTLEAVDRQMPALTTSLTWLGPTFTGLATVGAGNDWFDIVVTGFGPLSADLIATLLSPVGGGG